MFSIIVSGRPIITEFQQITASQIAFSIPSSPSFNHIVVFLLPGNVLPDGTGAAVYAQLEANKGFQLLGAIANEKPSAIFKLSAPSSTVPNGEPVLLGISLEPLEQLQASLANLQQNKGQNTPAQGFGSGMELALARSNATAPVNTKILAQRIIKNAYNFLASFSGNLANGVEVVPLKSFQEWWKKFENRIETDPGFLERDTEG
jgi:protein Hikeshi